jgi:hypothetical protein
LISINAETGRSILVCETEVIETWGDVMKRNLILSGLPIVVVACSLLSATAQAQFTQQAKLVGTGVQGPLAFQGWSVSLSGDGNTAIAGGPEDNGSAGAAWVFTRSGGVWNQQAKLIGTGAIGSIAVSAAVILTQVAD